MIVSRCGLTPFLACSWPYFQWRTAYFSTKRATRYRITWELKHCCF